MALSFPHYNTQLFNQQTFAAPKATPGAPGAHVCQFRPRWPHLQLAGRSDSCCCSRCLLPSQMILSCYQSRQGKGTLKASALQPAVLGLRHPPPLCFPAPFCTTSTVLARCGQTALLLACFWGCSSSHLECPLLQFSHVNLLPILQSCISLLGRSQQSNTDCRS